MVLVVQTIFLEGAKWVGGGFTTRRKRMFQCFKKHTRICWGVCRPCISVEVYAGHVYP